MYLCLRKCLYMFIMLFKGFVRFKMNEDYCFVECIEEKNIMNF